MKFNWYLGGAVVNGETYIVSKPQIDCIPVRFLFTVAQPVPARLKSRRGSTYAQRSWLRGQKVARAVRLEQIQLGHTLLMIEQHERIGNGSLISRGGIPLGLFDPIKFPITLEPHAMRKEQPLALRLYGSSYGLRVNAYAIVEDGHDCTKGLE